MAIAGTEREETILKKFLSILLLCALLTLSFTGCDRQSVDAAEQAAEQDSNFAPDTTAITSQATSVPVADEAAQQPAEDASLSAAQDPVAVDATAEPAYEQVTSEPASNSVPFATATPQPNTAVSGYTEISGTGLGFKFSYPTGWNNIPGRSTVCYVQPLENGTVYPARIAVTMKKLAHKCTSEKAQNELLEYVKLLMEQYDASTFEIAKELDTDTKFMGNQAISTTYLAYDGKQEIQGYVILTWFEKYVFCYHFLCAYEDYAAFDSTMRYVRDSVQAVQEDLPSDD